MFKRISVHYFFPLLSRDPWQAARDPWPSPPMPRANDATGSDWVRITG